VFVFSPSLLLVVPGFTWPDFIIAFGGCIIGITCLSAALSGYMLAVAKKWERLVLGFAAILLVATEIYSSLLGLALIVPVVIRQLAARKSALSAA